MDTIVHDCLKSLTLGEAQTTGAFAVFPLFSDQPEGPEYRTMDEALAAGVLRITEVSSGGSVPELLAENEGDLAVLLLDGEELVGAKQNRILNTTILLAPKSKKVIPVSCTEQGRWNYLRPDFAASELVAFARVRRTKSESVSESLRQHAVPRSNQAAVWEAVDQVLDASQARSSTSAMRDAYLKRADELDRFVLNVPVQEGQRGLLACLGQRVIGFDYVSRPSAYARLHRKLLRSYAGETLIEKSDGEPCGKQAVQAFLATCLRADGEAFPSTGLGTDYRIGGEGVVGSALLYERVVIHLACFPRDGGDTSGRLASPGTRRRFRGDLWRR